MRQFGYTQTIPAPPVGSWVSYDDIHDRWMHYSEHMVAAGEVCAMPGQCASDYMDWFFRILHPFMTPGQTSDPLPDRHGPQPPVVPPEPRAPSTSTMDEPRHAVVSNTNNLRQYFHNKLCNLFVLYLTGNLQ